VVRADRCTAPACLSAQLNQQLRAAAHSRLCALLRELRGQAQGALGLAALAGQPDGLACGLGARAEVAIARLALRRVRRGELVHARRHGVNGGLLARAPVRLGCLAPPQRAFLDGRHA
jgi:hypothetical protein